MTLSPRAALLRMPMFALLGHDWLDRWLDTARERYLDLGDTLYQRNFHARWVYVVLRGKVRVLRYTSQGRELALGAFQAGDVFGEYALLSPEVLPATCRAGDASRILQLRLRYLREIVQAHSELSGNLRAWLRLHALLRYLRENAYLGFMSAPSFLPLQQRFRSETLATGSTIQATGLNADRWFYLESGSIQLEYPDGFTATLGPGDCFGERALAGAEQLPLATTVTDSRVLSLTREEFLAPLEDEGPRSRQTNIGTLPGKAALYPWIAQREAADCGVAALTMVARAHGRSLSADHVRKLVPVGEHGSNLAELRRGAEAIGFSAVSIRVSLEQLVDVRLPVIALLLQGHFVVVYGCSGKDVVVGDPASGIQTWALPTFGSQWGGNLLVLTPPVIDSPSVTGSWLRQQGTARETPGEVVASPREATPDESTFCELIDRLRAGDGAVVAHLVEGYETSLLRVIRTQFSDHGTHKLKENFRSVLNIFCIQAALGLFDLKCPRDLANVLAGMVRDRLAASRQSESAIERMLAQGREMQASDSSGKPFTSKHLLEAIRERFTSEERCLSAERVLGRSWSDLAAERGTEADQLRRQLQEAVNRSLTELGTFGPDNLEGPN